MPTINRLNLYLLANSTWFLGFGIQMVLFAWLITIELHESPTRVGVAQMALLLPGLALLLVGGSLADRYGGRAIAILGQSAATLGPVGMIVVIESGNLDFQSIIVFALWMGTAQALVTPARDGLLSQLAGGEVQRLVIKVSMIQFGIQVIGFLIASQADGLGASVVLGAQSIVLATGVVAFVALRVDEPVHSVPADAGFLGHVARSIVEGFRTIRGQPALLSVTLQNLAMGTFLMGSYVVTLPLLIRQNYEGTSGELASVNTVNAVGLFLSSMVLLRIGGVKRSGRALLLALGAAGFLLLIAAWVSDFRLLLLVIFLWGVAGGLVMTMARSIMQELAPPAQRGRIMAFFSLSFMGAGLVGSLLNGYLVDLFRAEGALVVAFLGITIAITLVRILSPLWQLESHGYTGVSGESRKK